MAKKVAPEIEPEIADDEDEGAGFVDERDEAELELAEFLAALGAGSSRISGKVLRVLRPEDEGVVAEGYVCRFPTVNPDTLEDDIAKAGGGGLYDVEFKVDGKYVRGGRRRIAISGPAKGAKGEEKPAAPAPTPAVNPEMEALKARLADMERESRRREEEERLSKTLANAVAAAVGPLKSELAELRAKAVAPVSATSPLEEALKLATFIEKRSEKTGPAPEVTALLETVKGLEKQIKAKEEEARREREEREREERKAFEAMILARLDEKPKSRDSAIKEAFAPIADAVAMSKLMRSATDEAEDAEDEDLSDLLKMVKRPLFDMLKSGIKKGGKVLAKTLEKQAKATGAAPPASFAGWLEALFNNTALAADVEFVRAGLSQYRPQVTEAAAVSDKAGLVAFAQKHLPIYAPQIAALPDGELAKFFAVTAQLRQSVHAADTTPPPAPEPEEPEDEDDEEDDDEDEGDEDE